MEEKKTVPEVIDQEAFPQEKQDEHGRRWVKKYVGGGAHFINWLGQYREIYGEENVEIEEVDLRGLAVLRMERKKCLEFG